MISLNLETGKYEKVKPPKRPICCVPGCGEEAHNMAGKGKYAPRISNAFKRAFGNRGYVCQKHHFDRIAKVLHNYETFYQVTKQNKLEKEEVAAKGILPGYNGNE
jgi:hypothetical protein